MDDLDPFDLSDVLVKLLQGATPGEGVTSDADGWFPLADVCLAVSVVMRRDVGAAHMELLTRAVPGFEILDARIRIASRPHRHRPPSLPDILFHASTAAALTRAWDADTAKLCIRSYLDGVAAGRFPGKRPGYLADLLLVDGDPARDVSILQHRERLLAIMQDGRFHKHPPSGRLAVQPMAAE